MLGLNLAKQCITGTNVGFRSFIFIGVWNQNQNNATLMKLGVRNYEINLIFIAKNIQQN